MKRTPWITIAALALGAAAQSQAQPAGHQPQQCFYANQFQGWRAADEKTIYIRVNLNDYYRLDMAGSCPTLTTPDARLINKVNGPPTICSAVDWNLSVSTQGPGAIATPCIVKSMRKLTPAEAAALPKKLRP